ncbi:HMG box transcription factor BBX isoform X1 [Ochotona princeps]|uniref:HMG box transcription factor BBX isoform X1 n=1 Tax=Ochotona princeps TaxID=9978 RepID=UPI00271549E8|nr:HMG box transcription factor BBX isoform X1 [Ochotona princeps]XP_012784696.2 HMG box transcription factor BBX isoform X1 [Ochotona princeps]XP_058517812.1 HMG box transcription factor BBX isoform X1 [Ochotona princeps]XP_058517813.1 HMG box transcription factor BBX isoform X1 [Ochotona princeps]XP_058517814.1 HMG box transcription factor BBX isoform X1 [Ochotona princeps]XP_058517815.1 HMG box transcription factor BBX isoform X1 [Ochotona princeps]XP_058517817.1 HMG box transcription fact
MKGSNINKDHSAEGEGAGKRPKRKCLQWHPLLAKKLLDFSEEEEEEDEEEDIDKVQLLGADGLEQDVGETEDDESPEQRARRPMNAFLLFCKRHRSLVRQEHPRLDNRGATKILADWWAVLDPKEKQKYTDMAKEYKDAFMKANPGYKWCPTTNKPVKSPTSTVNPRKKLWAFPSDSSRDLPSPKKAKTEETPQLNFGMADPTQMGGLSMLLLAGEHALGTPEISSGTGRADVSESPELRQKSPLFQFAEISSSTSHPDAPTKQCQTSALFQFAEISSNTSQLGGAEPVKRCGKSALFQLAEMCLASEGVKMEESKLMKAKESDGGRIRELEKGKEEREMKMERTDEARLQKEADFEKSAKENVRESKELRNFEELQMGDVMAIKMEDPKEIRKEELEEDQKCSHFPDFSYSASSKIIISDVPSRKDHMCRPHGIMIIEDPIALNKPEKLKKKKKKSKMDRHGSDKSTPKKTCKKRQSSESDIESVIYTIEAVAKGDWGIEKLGEAPRKKVRPSSSGKGSILDAKPPKKKVKSREKKMSKEKSLDTTKESRPPDFISLSTSKNISGELPESIKTEPLTPTEDVLPPSLSGQAKTEDSDCHRKIETCGFRKSERSCKGALYKTLVSEGMLTSLRANVDRGKRSSGKGNSSDHEGCWNEESWTFSQSGSSGSKKFKKTKPREDSFLGSSKLDEEFEKKFNSLPQYSPVSFDRKCVPVPRKKKKTGTMSSESAKTSKGPFQSQKKNFFHKIVSKYKHKKEKPNVPEKGSGDKWSNKQIFLDAIHPTEAIFSEDKNTIEPAHKVKNALSLPNTPEPTIMQEPLVGSQKRKARKTKITHLVRTADGRVSPAGGSLDDKPKEHLRRSLPKVAEADCNDECSHHPEAEETRSSTPEMPAVSAFFSLAALAEVAAMENVHRGQRSTPLTHDGQPKEMPQAPVLISCADQ